ncbi:MAG: S8 family serine peptidase, partial [Clostridia bacterium]|nr:S8 family serine peptidase [Clostridia bacterium]
MKEMLKKYRLPIIITVVLLIAALTVGVVLLVNKQNSINNRDKIVKELLSQKGEYDEQSIVLYDTTEHEAKVLAEKLGASLRITKNGRFATLTLPDDVSIIDICTDDKFVNDVSKMSIDWHVRTSDLDEEEEYEENEAYGGIGVPEIPEDIYDTSSIRYHIPTRPVYDVADDAYPAQSYLDFMNLQNVWEHTKGEGVTVAVIDTGIDTRHPEFAGRISEYSYNASEDRIVKDYLLDENDPTSYDWSIIEDVVGHGTAVAGVLAAAMDGVGTVGIAPE